MPVCTPLPLVYCTASGKVQHSTFAKGAQSRLARPGVMSDSWMTTGTPLNFAPYTTGTDTNPPLENTTLGFSLRMMPVAWRMPRITRKGSVKFLGSKYRRSLPTETV